MNKLRPGEAIVDLSVPCVIQCVTHGTLRYLHGQIQAAQERSTGRMSAWSGEETADGLSADRKQQGAAAGKER